MKTSKIIFITLLATIALYILAAMVDVRINGVKVGTIKGPDVSLQKHYIPAFKVLYLSNSINVVIIQGDSSYIEVASPKGSPYQLNYKINNDTLRLSDVKIQINKNGYLSLKVSFADSLKCVISENSRFVIERMSTSIMTLNMNGSSVRFSEFQGGVSSFRTLYIIAKNNSTINCMEVKVDSLLINLQNSEAYLSMSAKTINGTLADGSKLVTRQPGEMYMKRDSTSTITLNNIMPMKSHF